MQTLERELKARTYAHKFAIVGAYYVQQQCKQTGYINLPLPIIEAQAVEEVPKFIQYLLENGLFNDAYEQAWESMKDKIPNDFILNLEPTNQMW